MRRARRQNDGRRRRPSGSMRTRAMSNNRWRARRRRTRGARSTSSCASGISKARRAHTDI